MTSIKTQKQLLLKENKADLFQTELPSALNLDRRRFSPALFCKFIVPLQLIMDVGCSRSLSLKYGWPKMSGRFWAPMSWANKLCCFAKSFQGDNAATLVMYTS